MNSKVNLNVILQQKQFVDKSGNVINYLSVTSEVDGIEIVFYPKDATSKQILNKYYSKAVLEALTAPDKK